MGRGAPLAVIRLWGPGCPPGQALPSWRGEAAAGTDLPPSHTPLSRGRPSGRAPGEASCGRSRVRLWLFKIGKGGRSVNTPHSPPPAVASGVAKPYVELLGLKGSWGGSHEFIWGALALGSVSPPPEFPLGSGASFRATGIPLEQPCSAFTG